MSAESFSQLCVSHGSSALPLVLVPYLVPEADIFQAVVVIIVYSCLFLRSHTSLTLNGNITSRITPQSSERFRIIFKSIKNGIRDVTFL